MRSRSVVTPGQGTIERGTSRRARSVLAALRSGDWLTQERRRLVCWMVLLASLALLVGVHATAHGLLDYQGRPLGTDFSQVWVAGRSVLAGDPAAPYDPVRHWAAQRAAFGPDAEFYGWLYPPLFLAPAAALALLPYWPALLVWTLGTLALYAATVWAALPRRDALLAALAFPAVFVNAGHGNNAFLTAALLGGGLLLLERRPVLAGLLLGLLAYKPQFGLLVPLALLAGGHGRAFAAAAATALATAAATGEAFGPGPWLGFLDSLAFSRTVVLEEGGAGFHRLQSAFAAVRLLGGGTTAAWSAQAVSALAAAALVVAAWRGGADPRLKAAVLVVGCLLATPYLFDYDFALLAPAGAMLASLAIARGWRPWEISAMALAWAAPLVSRNLAQAAHLPLGLASLLLLLVLLARRLHGERII